MLSQQILVWRFLSLDGIHGLRASQCRHRLIRRRCQSASGCVPGIGDVKCMEGAQRIGFEKQASGGKGTLKGLRPPEHHAGHSIRTKKDRCFAAGGLGVRGVGHDLWLVLCHGGESSAKHSRRGRGGGRGGIIVILICMIKHNIIIFIIIIINTLYYRYYYYYYCY